MRGREREQRGTERRWPLLDLMAGPELIHCCCSTWVSICSVYSLICASFSSACIISAVGLWARPLHQSVWWEHTNVRRLESCCQFLRKMQMWTLIILISSAVLPTGGQCVMWNSAGLRDLRFSKVAQSQTQAAGCNLTAIGLETCDTAKPLRT